MYHFTEFLLAIIYKVLDWPFANIDTAPIVGKLSSCKLSILVLRLELIHFKFPFLCLFSFKHKHCCSLQPHIKISIPSTRLITHEPLMFAPFCPYVPIDLWPIQMVTFNIIGFRFTNPI